MRKVKEVLRLRFELGLGQRQIARSCGMGLGTVHEYLERAVAAEARHDREEARTHAADIIAVASAQADIKAFRQDFETQFLPDPTLGVRVFRTADRYFRTSTSPGLLVYEEHLAGDKPPDRDARNEVADELARAHRLLLDLVPPNIFFQLLAGIEDCCDIKRNRTLVEEFLQSLDNAGISIHSKDALQFVPTVVFGGAFSRSEKFVVSTGEVLAQLTDAELRLARQHLLTHAEQLQDNEELTKRYVRALRGTDAQNTV